MTSNNDDLVKQPGFTLELFGNDLERAWREIEDGVELFWLAATIGLDSTKIISTGRKLVAEAFAQLETPNWETAQVLEAVQAWENGDISAQDVDRSSWDAYHRIALIGGNDPLPPGADEVADAAVWLAHLVMETAQTIPETTIENEPAQTSDRFASTASLIVDRLASVLPVTRGFDASSWDRYKKSYDEASSRLAHSIRQQIDFSEILAAAQQKGSQSI